MSLLLPFEEAHQESISNVNSIGINPRSGLIAYLQPDKILIKSLLTINYDLITEYTLNPDLIQRYGMCHWIQWVNNETLAYGTCSGTVFISHFDGSLKNPMISLINAVITSTFAAHDFLVVCTAKSELIFINNNAITSRITIGDKRTGIRSPRFVPPSTLACIVDDKPAIVPFEKHSVIKGFTPLVQSYPYENSTLACIGIETNQLAIALPDGSVILHHMVTGGSIEIAPPSNEPIKLLTWVLNYHCILIVYDSGRVLVRSVVSQLSNECQIPALADARTVAFAPMMTTLIAASSDTIHYIDFMQCRNIVFWTPRKCGIFFKTEQPVVVPQTLYPISGVIENAGKIVIWNKAGIQYNADYIKLPNIQACTFILDYLVVFVRDTRVTFMLFFKDFSSPCHKFEFPHPVKRVHALGNQLIASCPTYYSLLTVGASGMHQLDDRFYSIDTTACKDEIRDAFLVWPSEVVVWFTNRRVKNQTRSALIYDDVGDAWFCTAPPVLFMNCADSTVLSYRGDIIRFEHGALFTNGSDFFFPEAKSEFGAIHYAARSFAPDFLRKSLQRVDAFTMMSGALSGSPNFPTILAITFQQALNVGGADLFAMYFESVPDQLRAKIIDALLPMLPDPAPLMKLKIRWHEFFQLLSPETRNKLVPALSLSVVGEVAVPSDIPALIENGYIMSAFLAAGQVVTDHFATLMDLSLAKCIEKVQEQPSQYGDHRLSRFLGSILQAKGYSKLALCVFVASGETDKAKSVLLIDDSTRKEVEETSDQSVKEFFKPVLP